MDHNSQPAAKSGFRRPSWAKPARARGSNCARTSNAVAAVSSSTSRNKNHSSPTHARPNARKRGRYDGRLIQTERNCSNAGTVLPSLLHLREGAWIDGKTYSAPTAELDVLDRVGGGDGFAAGFIYGLLSGEAPDEAVKLGWAHGALLTTFPGDTTMATVDQVRAFAKGGSARIQR